MTAPFWLALPPTGAEDAFARRVHSVRATDGSTVVNPLTAADQTTINQIRAGDEPAFDTLFRAWYPRLVGFAESLVLSVDVAEDVVSEVFQRIWSRHAEWEPGGAIGAYLFRAVRNEAGNERRRVRRSAERDAGLLAAGEHPGVGTGPVTPDARLEASEWQRQVWAIVDAMPETRRAAAHLRWQEGMEYSDIAHTLGLSSAAVQMHVSRALRALRAILREREQ